MGTRPMASHISISRRLYRKMSDTKSGKRHHLSARPSWQRACQLGFRGNLESGSDSWPPLPGARVCIVASALFSQKVERWPQQGPIPTIGLWRVARAMVSLAYSRGRPARRVDQ
jgi:hypothetical protein